MVLSPSTADNTEIAGVTVLVDVNQVGAPLTVGDHDAGLTVVDVERVVVAGDQQGAAGVPGRAERATQVGCQPLLDVLVPRPDAVRPLAVRAQEPLALEQRQGVPPLPPVPPDADLIPPAIESLPPELRARLDLAP